MRAERAFLLLALPLTLIYLYAYFPLRHYNHGIERFLHVMHYAMQLRGQEGRMPVSVIDTVRQANYGVLWKRFGAQFSGWYAEAKHEGYPLQRFDKPPKESWGRFRQLMEIPLNVENTVAFRTGSNAATYPIIGYLPFVVPAVIGIAVALPPIAILYLMVVTGALLGIAIGYYTVRIIPILKWPMVFLLLMPGAFVSRHVISPDALTIELCFLLIAITLKWRATVPNIIPGRKSEYIALSASAGLIKGTYFLLPAVACLIPQACFSGRMQRWLFIAACVTISFTAAVWWDGYVIHKQHKIDILSGSVAAKKSSNDSFGRQLQNIIHHPVEYVAAMAHETLQPEVLHVMAANVLLWNGHLWVDQNWMYQNELIAGVMTGMVLLLMLVIFPPPGESVNWHWRERIFCLGLFLAVAFLVITAGVLISARVLAPDSPPITPESLQYVQGRYFLPALPLLLLAFWRPLPDRGKRLPRLLVWLAGIFLLEINLLMLLWLL